MISAKGDTSGSAVVSPLLFLGKEESNLMKRMTFKQFVFIIPLLVLIGVFSIYPIITSLFYTVFDYRVNDQQYNKFYLSDYFNESLFEENCKYIGYYLSPDMELIEDADSEKFTAIKLRADEMADKYGGESTQRKLSGDEKTEIKNFIEETRQEINDIYAQYPGVEFRGQENVNIIMDSLESCFIESNFIGADGYKKLLGDQRFFRALAHTGVFTVVSVAAELVIGMLLALVMSRSMRGINLVRTTILIPWAIPTSVAAMIWLYMYDGSYGVVSKIFSAIGIIPSQASMLLTSSGAMASVILADIWKATPYMALLLLAGLQTIDSGLYESAAIDGANKIQTFFRITLPLMKPSIMVALLFRTLDAFRVYDMIAILTGGGPGNGTESLSVYTYKLMFAQGNYGYGSVVVMGLFVCVAVIAFLYVKVLGAEVLSDK